MVEFKIEMRCVIPLLSLDLQSSLIIGFYLSLEVSIFLYNDLELDFSFKLTLEILWEEEEKRIFGTGVRMKDLGDTKPNL